MPSPFQNIPPEILADETEAPPLRRLQSPAERFRTGASERDAESPFDETAPLPQPGLNAPDERADSELEPPARSMPASHAPAAGAPATNAPDPFERLPNGRVRAEARARPARGADSRRARRRLKQHAPHYHEKKPHAVAHKPVKPGAAAPPSAWDTAAQNSMARAALARKKGRVRRIVGRAALAGTVLLSVWGLGTALTAPQFEVDRVEITGTRGAPPAKVKALAGELIGRNVFRAPRARLETQLKAVPIVADARIARGWSWPPHMKVQITERQPILQVGAGTTWWVVDAQGVAFRRADRKDSGLDMLTSPELQPATGKALPAAQWKRARQLEAALSADNALVARQSGEGMSEGAGAGKFWDLRRVYLDENSAAALRISDKGALKRHGETLIRLGEEGWAAKLKQARLALAFFERTGREASELDLVSSEHPRWKPKQRTPDDSAETQGLNTSQD